MGSSQLVRVFPNVCIGRKGLLFKIAKGRHKTNFLAEAMLIYSENSRAMPVLLMAALLQHSLMRVSFNGCNADTAF